MIHLAFLGLLHFIHCILCFGHHYTPFMPSLPFEHLHKNTAINGPQPWYDGEVPSKDHCFDKCVKNFTDCVYVQYKEVTATTWLCKLYGVISDLSNYLVSTDGEMLAKAIHKNLGCREWGEMGHTTNKVYYIFHNRRKAKVFCLLSASNAWIMIQRRKDGKVWEGYKKGFGDPNSEYWLGNDMIHELTKDREMVIYFRGWSFANEYVAVAFQGFRIEDEGNKYRLHTGAYDFGASALSNDWTELDGMYFSAPGRDNDNATGHCARNLNSGWWFNNCGKMGFNGVYSQNSTIDSKKGIYWASFKGNFESLKKVEIYIRSPT